MKKAILIFVAFLGLVSFTTRVTNVEDLFANIANIVKESPSNTVYGVVKSDNSNVVVNTPLGECSVNKSEDGTYSFMGIDAKLVSKKGSTYVVSSSIGKYKIDTKKCTITKLEK